MNYNQKFFNKRVVVLKAVENLFEQAFLYEDVNSLTLLKKLIQCRIASIRLDSTCECLDSDLEKAILLDYRIFSFLTEKNIILNGHSFTNEQVAKIKNNILRFYIRPIEFNANDDVNFLQHFCFNTLIKGGVVEKYNQKYKKMKDSICSSYSSKKDDRIVSFFESLNEDHKFRFLLDDKEQFIVSGHDIIKMFIIECPTSNQEMLDIQNKYFEFLLKKYLKNAKLRNVEDDCCTIEGDLPAIDKWEMEFIRRFNFYEALQGDFPKDFDVSEVAFLGSNKFSEPARKAFARGDSFVCYNFADQPLSILDLIEELIRIRHEARHIYQCSEQSLLEPIGANAHLESECKRIISDKEEYYRNYHNYETEIDADRRACFGLSSSLRKINKAAYEYVFFFSKDRLSLPKRKFLENLLLKIDENSNILSPWNFKFGLLERKIKLNPKVLANKKGLHQYFYADGQMKSFSSLCRNGEITKMCSPNSGMKGNRFFSEFIKYQFEKNNGTLNIQGLNVDAHVVNQIACVTNLLFQEYLEYSSDIFQLVSLGHFDELYDVRFLYPYDTTIFEKQKFTTKKNNAMHLLERLTLLDRLVEEVAQFNFKVNNRVINDFIRKSKEVSHKIVMNLVANMNKGVRSILAREKNDSYDCYHNLYHMLSCCNSFLDKVTEYFEVNHISLDTLLKDVDGKEHTVNSCREFLFDTVNKKLDQLEFSGLDVEKRKKIVMNYEHLKTKIGQSSQGKMKKLTF